MTQYQKGESGNPNGRPKGKTAATMIRESISEHMPELISVLVAQAKSGDVAAIKILIDRVCPPLKSQSMAVSLPVHESRFNQCNEIMQAILSGELETDIGLQLLAAITAQAKVGDDRESLRWNKLLR